MTIDNVKCINHLTFHFPLEKGLYAITGKNASGKSTLVAYASTVLQTKDSHRPDTLVSLTGTSPCTHAIEPTSTERYARW